MSQIAPISPDEIVARIADLPPMPASIQEVISACDDHDMTVGQLSQIILRDQSLTAGILKLANSAFYGHARRVNTITEAVVLLGFSAIKSLAISAHTARLLDKAFAGYGMGAGELWRHSVAVAFSARRLAIEAQLAPVEEAFVAGLLHDIGKTILSSYLERAFGAVSEHCQSQRVPFHVAEAELLGFDHAELGARVAAAWAFPPELEEAIRCHHEPSRAKLKPLLAYVIHLADASCMMLGLGLGADGLAYAIEPTTLEVLGIGPERLVELMDELEPLVSADLQLLD